MLSACNQRHPKIQVGQSGEEGSKHLIFCISMANKVIKCIEITQNAQILKIADFAK